MEDRQVTSKAKARLVARGFGQQSGMNYFKTSMTIPVISSINKVALAVALQQRWKLQH